MSLPTIDQMVNEISDRMGTRSELTGNEALTTPWTAPTGRIERALNDALMEIVATYKIRLWESQYNWYFKSNLYQAGTATNAANSVTVTGVGAAEWVYNVLRPGPPSAALASPAVAGNVDDGTHNYRVTFVTDYGETEGSRRSATMTVTNKAVNGQVTVTIPTGGPFVTARKIYRCEAGKTLDGPWWYVGEVANNTATTFTDNVADATIVNGGAGIQVPTANGANSIDNEWLFKFDDEDTWHEIIGSYKSAGIYYLTVSPRITEAHTSASYTIVQNRWEMPSTFGGDPNDIFCILDVRDVEQQRRIEAADYRMMDRSMLATGAPTNYSRVKQHILLWPAPDTADIYFKLRYYSRPPYKQTGRTPPQDFRPLPEEWHSVLMDLATGRVLQHQMEDQRAQVYFQLAQQKAQAIMSVAAEESEDYRVAIKPNSLYMSSKG